MKQTHSVVGPAMATSSELLCVIMQSQDALQYLRWPEETDKNKSNLGRVSSSLTTDSINYNCTVTNPKSWRVQCSVCGAFSLFRWTKLKVWVLQTECVLQCVLVFRLVYYLWRELCSEKTRLQQSKQTHTSRRWCNIRGWHERRLGRSDQEGSVHTRHLNASRVMTSALCVETSTYITGTKGTQCFKYKERNIFIYT